MAHPATWTDEQKALAEARSSCPPEADLQLEHIHGFAAAPASQQLRFMAHGTVACFAAQVGIVHDLEQNKQTHFGAHGRRISCLALHPAGRLVATAEAAGEHHRILVWEGSGGRL